ncbi:hypothetical protein Tco_0337249, partial [Tanacetum coccineum]
MLAIPHHSQVLSMAEIDSKEAQKKLKAGICFRISSHNKHTLFCLYKETQKKEVEEKKTSAINRAFSFTFSFVTLSSFNANLSNSFLNRIMEISKADQITLDDALVAHANQLKIGKCILRIKLGLYVQKDANSKFVYDVLKLTPFYKAFQVSADVPEIYMQDLVHSGEIEEKITDVNVNKLHQPWRSFAAIINKCLSGKTSYDSLRLSQAQILWGMYNNKKIENKNTKKGNAIDDPMFTTINVILRNDVTQLLQGKIPPKTKAQVRKKADSDATTKQKPPTVSKKRRQRRLEKIITKRSRKETHNSHANGSGADEGTGVSPGVLDATCYGLRYDDDSDNEVKGVDVEGAKSDDDDTYGEDQGNEAAEDTNANLEGRNDVMTDVILPQVQATQEIEDTHVTLTPVNPDGQQQSSSVSSGFVSNMLNPNQDTGVDTIFGQHAKATSLIDTHVTAIAEPSFSAPTNRPPTPNPLVIQ